MATEPTIITEDTSAAKLQVSEERLRQFQQMAFGLSAHWGLYSVCGGGSEWAYYNNRVPLEAYRLRMDRFNPVRFDAEEWADLMVEAGQRFLLITSKHHDGFCLWDTALTDFKATRTRFGRDILAELAPALADHGLELHFYYSLVDWTHPAYRKNWPEYVAYYQAQLRELCTRFGKIGGIIFDGYWPRVRFEPGDHADYFQPRGPWDLAGSYDLIHQFQPEAIVVNNTHIPPLQGEDLQIWELDLPGENTIGFNGTEIGAKPVASWWNLNSGWSYQPMNHRVRSAAEILEAYRKVRARNGVFYLNVGPRGFGDIHPDEQRVLREIGQTLRAEQKQPAV